MKFRLLALVLAFLFINKNSYSSEQSFAAKITSGPCHSRNSQIKGSGTLFNYGDAVYFLTSEHVVYHTKKDSFCHTIKNHLIGEASAELLFADWGSGMALLKVATKANNQILNFPSDFKKLDSSEVLIAGSPFEQTTVISTSGIISNDKGERLLSPIIKHTLEIDGAHGEFGMSGGPITQIIGGKHMLRGFLSHQVLIMKLGIPSRAGDWDPNNKYQNQLLGIDVEDIVIELKKYFNDPLKFKVSYYRETLGQMKGANVIIGNGLVFRPFIMSNSNQSKLQNMSIQSFSRGGVDPIGIGGVDSTDPVYTALDVEIFNGQEEFATATPASFPETYQTTISKIKKILFVNQAVRIPFLVYQNNEDDLFSLTAVKPRSIDENFSMLTDVQYSLIVKNMSNNDQQKVQSLGEMNLMLLQKINGGKLELDNQSLYADLVTLSHLAEENNLELVKCSSLNSLISRSPEADYFWSDMLKIDFDVSTKLLQNIKFFAKSCSM
jgi:hypothetical protein